MKKIKVFETFAGIGAQHKALEILKQNNILDYEVVATSEWDMWANISYNAIHHNNKNIAADLSDEEINEFLSNFTHSNDSKKPVKIEYVLKQPRHIREMLYTSIIESNNLGSVTEIKAEKLIEVTKGIDLLTYSFPCQDLSVAGSIHGFNQGMAKGSGTRSGLLWEIERILKELKKLDQLPKYLLLENVKNMISEKHKDDYIRWLKFLKKIGYNTQTYILSAQDYGIPQTRERVFALSVLGDNENFTDTLTQNKTIRSYDVPIDISKKVGISKTLPESLNTNYDDKQINDEVLQCIPNRTPSRYRMFQDNYVLTTKDEKLKTSREKARKHKYEKINNRNYLNKIRTITTKQDRNPNAGVIDLRGENVDIPKGKAKYRFLTPRETYKLMGFTDEDYDAICKNIEIRKEVKYRQAGNSIVVNVLVSIFNKLKEIK